MIIQNLWVYICKWSLRFICIQGCGCEMTENEGVRSPLQGAHWTLVVFVFVILLYLYLYFVFVSGYEMTKRECRISPLGGPSSWSVRLAQHVASYHALLSSGKSSKGKNTEIVLICLKSLKYINFTRIVCDDQYRYSHDIKYWVMKNWRNKTLKLY